MVNALKKIDKKILIIAGIILFLPILIIIFLAIIQGCSNSSNTPEKYEEKMISAAEKYFDEKGLPEEEAEVKTVKLSTLVKNGYIKSTEKLLKDNSCKGSVSVRLNGSNIKETEEGFYNYTVELNCDNYKTKTLKNMVMDDLTTSGNGLYELNEHYVFKGDVVNNYITFFGDNYRILNMDSSGLVKLLKVDYELLDRVWDNKYNIEIDMLSGINNYSESAILKSLKDDYYNEKIFSDSSRKHLVAKDICIDSTLYSEGNLKNYNCTNKVEKQVLSLVDIDDYAMASLDANCNNLYAKSCVNYNYLNDIRIMSWTMNALTDNSYEVYFMSNGNPKRQNASEYNYYHLVIHIDGNEKILSGIGTEEDPYVIK